MSISSFSSPDSTPPCLQPSNDQSDSTHSSLNLSIPSDTPLPPPPPPTLTSLLQQHLLTVPSHHNSNPPPVSIPPSSSQFTPPTLYSFQAPVPPSVPSYPLHSFPTIPHHFPPSSLLYPTFSQMNPLPLFHNLPPPSNATVTQFPLFLPHSHPHPPPPPPHLLTYLDRSLSIILNDHTRHTYLLSSLLRSVRSSLPVHSSSSVTHGLQIHHHSRKRSHPSLSQAGNYQAASVDSSTCKRQRMCERTIETEEDE